MLGLPKSTELTQALPKARIFAKFDLKSAQKESFDADVSRMSIVNVISPRTIPALSAGNTKESIYVVELILKRQNYAPKNIQLLCKLIPQNLLFLLRYEAKSQLALFHTKLLASPWGEEPEIVLSGLDIDAAWDNLVKRIGDVKVKEGNTLEEQLHYDEARAKLLKQIEVLEKKARIEKQPRRKLELFEELKEMKELLKR